MEIWYEAYLVMDSIKKIEVIKRTKCFLFLKNGVRVAIKSNYINYYNTFNEAQKKMIINLEKKIEKLNESIEWHKNRINKIKNIKES